MCYVVRWPLPAGSLGSDSVGAAGTKDNTQALNLMAVPTAIYPPKQLSSKEEGKSWQSRRC